MLLRARAPVFLRKGQWQAKEVLATGYKWVVSDGKKIIATRILGFPKRGTLKLRTIGTMKAGVKQFLRCLIQECWHAAGFSLDTSQVFFALDWLLNKLETSNYDESIKLPTVLWGIWLWRNKKIWVDKIVSADTVMELSFNTVHEWRKARKQEEPSSTSRSNADGIVVRDHNGMFIEAKVMSLPRSATILEAKSIGVREDLSWIIQRGDEQGIIESDSLLTIRALQGKKKYLLEVGHVEDSCKSLIQSILGFVFSYARKQANKEIPRDKTGDFDLISRFLEKNWKIAKWAAFGAVIFEGSPSKVSCEMQGSSTMYHQQASLSDMRRLVVDMLVEGDGMVASFDENVIENVGSPEPGFLFPFGVW
ncbi:hypothetical protein AgCh_009302 [Apium graveolens]